MCYSAPISLILTSNFFQTRGTAINIVARAHCKFSVKVPYKASGLAKNIYDPIKI